MTIPSKEAIGFFQTWIDARMEVDIWDTDSLKEGLQGCYAIDFAAHQSAYDELAKRCNQLEHLVGSIAELLRKDMTNES